MNYAQTVILVISFFLATIMILRPKKLDDVKVALGLFGVIFVLQFLEITFPYANGKALNQKELKERVYKIETSSDHFAVLFETKTDPLTLKTKQIGEGKLFCLTNPPLTITNKFIVVKKEGGKISFHPFPLPTTNSAPSTASKAKVER